MQFVTPPENPAPNILLYGPAKTGKTAGAASAPGQLLYFNCDLANATRFAHTRNRGRINEPYIPPYEKGKTPVFDTMGEIGRMVLDPEKAPGAVIVDPVGELHRRLLEESSNRAIRPVLNAYGDVSTYVERFCRHLCESPVTTVLVAHDHPVKDEGNGDVERLPWTGTSNPALGQKLLGMVDIIAYTGIAPPATEGEKEQYIAQVRSLKGRRGGDRFNCLEPLEVVNIADWIDRIRAAELAEAEQVAAEDAAAAKAAVPVNAEPQEAKAA